MISLVLIFTAKTQRRKELIIRKISPATLRLSGKLTFVIAS